MNGNERDLVIGVPGKGLFGRARAGMIHVVYGSSSGLAVAGNQFWHQARLQSDEGVEPATSSGGRSTDVALRHMRVFESEDGKSTDRSVGDIGGGVLV